MAKHLNFDRWYRCPDCGAELQGHDLQLFAKEETPYVCPDCGCVQDTDYVEQQLGKED